MNFCSWKSTAGVCRDCCQGGRDCDRDCARVAGIAGAGIVSLTDNPGSCSSGDAGPAILDHVSPRRLAGDSHVWWRNGTGEAWALSVAIPGACTEPGTAAVCVPVAVAGSRPAVKPGWARLWGPRCAPGRPARSSPAGCGRALPGLCARRGKSHSEGLSAASGPVSPCEMSPEPCGTAPGAAGSELARAGTDPGARACRAAGRAQTGPDAALSDSLQKHPPKATAQTGKRKKK